MAEAKDLKNKAKQQVQESKDYETILSKMTHQSETHQKQIKDLKLKAQQSENRVRHLTDQVSSRDEQVISLGQKNIFYEDKIRELEKEI